MICGDMTSLVRSKNSLLFQEIGLGRIFQIVRMELFRDQQEITLLRQQRMRSFTTEAAPTLQNLLTGVLGCHRISTSWRHVCFHLLSLFVATHKWSKVDETGPGLVASVMIYFEHNLYLFGGLNAAYQPSNGMWVYGTDSAILTCQALTVPQTVSSGGGNTSESSSPGSIIMVSLMVILAISIVGVVVLFIVRKRKGMVSSTAEEEVKMRLLNPM